MSRAAAAPLKAVGHAAVGAVALRAGLLGLAAWMGMQPGPGHMESGWIGALAAIGLLLLPLEFLSGRWLGRTARLTVHYVVDVALLSGLLLAGGAQALLYAPLYLLVVAASGAATGLVGGLLTGSLAAVAYPLVVRVAHLAALESVEWTRVSVLSLTFVCVGALAGVMGHEARAHRRAREEAELRARRAELDVEGIVLNMSSGLLTVDSDGGIGLCNRAATEILGLTASEMRGKSFREALPDGLLEFKQALEAALSRGRTRQRAEIDIRRPDESSVPLGISISILREADGRRRGAIAVFQDLTEARSLERQARRQETLAAIGGLSAGVAHEIRNCLNPITGSIEMLRSEFEVEGEAQRLMDLITREGERLNQFIGELLAFARVEELRPTRVDLGSLVEEVTRLLECHPRRKPGQAIRCEVDGACAVRVDGEHLRRVFVNLGLNALEAMGDTGSLRIRLARTESGEGETAVAVVFEDTGSGIRETDLPHIFEPFFTTKQDGTGLGLALAQQVVARHGGRIEAESRFGEGTRMTVCLPAEAGEPALARAS